MGRAEVAVQTEPYPKTGLYRKYNREQRRFLRRLRYRLRILAAGNHTIFVGNASRVAAPRQKKRLACGWKWNPRVNWWEATESYEEVGGGKPNSVPVAYSEADIPKGHYRRQTLHDWDRLVFPVWQRDRSIRRRECLIQPPPLFIPGRDPVLLTEYYSKKPTELRCEPLPYKFVRGSYRVVSLHSEWKYWLLSLCESKDAESSIHPDESLPQAIAMEWWEKAYERDARRPKWTKEWTKLYRKDSTKWPRLHGITIPKEYRVRPWYRRPRDFSPAVSISKNGAYFRMRTGKHTSLGNVPPFVLSSLNSNDLDVLDNSQDEKRRVFVVRKVVQMTLQHLLMSGQAEIYRMAESAILHENGMQRRLRLERPSVWKTLMSKIGLLRSDGNSAIEAAIRLRPFAWAFRHPSEKDLF